MKSMRRIFVIWFRCGWRGELDAAVLGGGWGWLLPSSCAASPWKLRLSVWCVGNFNWGPCIVLHSMNIGLLLCSPPCAHKKYKVKYLFLLFFFFKVFWFVDGVSRGQLTMWALDISISIANHKGVEQHWARALLEKAVWQRLPSLAARSCLFI